MLDLTNYNNKYEVKWIDGRVLQVPPPPQYVYEKIMKMDVNDESAILPMLYSTLEECFKPAGLTKDDIATLSMPVALMLFKDYFNHTTKELAKVNFQ